MLLHVGRRTQQSFFFAAPQRHADGAVHLQVERFQNAHHFHGHGAACAVVGGAGAHVPGIEVAAHHDQFVGLGGAGDLGDHVERIGVAGIEIHLDVEGKLHRDVVLQQARDAVVVFGGDGDGGHVLGRIAGARRAVAGEYRAAFAAAVGGDGQQDAFILAEGALLFLKGLALFGSHGGESAGLAAAASAASASGGATGGNQVGHHLRQFGRRCSGAPAAWWGTPVPRVWQSGRSCLSVCPSTSSDRRASESAPARLHR